MEKRKITNISSVGIIYRVGDPLDLFLEVKDDEHPIKAVRRGLCFIGGNWIGEAAKGDACPRDTFRRELMEELSFDRPRRSMLELAHLGLAESVLLPSVGEVSRMPTDEDVRTLSDLKWEMMSRCERLCDAVITIPKSVLDAADPENKCDGFTTLVVYHTVALFNDGWGRLMHLQAVFGNLSNESITTSVNVHDIIALQKGFAFGHDIGLRRFLGRMGYNRSAWQVSGDARVTQELMFADCDTYAQYLNYYDVAKKPA